MVVARWQQRAAEPKVVMSVDDRQGVVGQQHIRVPREYRPPGMFLVRTPRGVGQSNADSTDSDGLVRIATTEQQSDSAPVSGAYPRDCQLTMFDDVEQTGLVGVACGGVSPDFSRIRVVHRRAAASVIAPGRPSGTPSLPDPSTITIAARRAAIAAAGSNLQVEEEDPTASPPMQLVPPRVAPAPGTDKEEEAEQRERGRIPPL